MSHPQSAKAAKLVIGLLVNDKALLDEVAADLERKFGAIDMISQWFDFKFTDYYSNEMGKPLFRRMVAFSRLIEQESLAQIKLSTNDLERAYAVNGRRSVNIDPGYLLYERFVLATGKNYSHRIYIGKGIYADLTLIFQKGSYQCLSWTYPDYRERSMISFLKQVRKKYGDDLRVQAPSEKAPGTL